MTTLEYHFKDRVVRSLSEARRIKEQTGEDYKQVYIEHLKEDAEDLLKQMQTGKTE